MSVELYLIGGAVRDKLMGVESKDYDFTVVADNGWDEMRQWLIDSDFNIFVETPGFLTIRAHFPKGWKFNGEVMSRLTGDFVLARDENDYQDGRHPSTVIPGTLYQDQKRRDFTVNSIAMDSGGRFIDPFNGREDIETMTLRAVGSAEYRIREDALRAVRALRFAITKGFTLDDELYTALFSDWLPELVAKVSVDRRREELMKCFKHDSLFTMRVLSGKTDREKDLVNAIFSGGLWLEPTNKSSK